MYPEFNPSLNKKRWVAYFDLLGSKQRISTKALFDVFSVFAKSVEIVRKESARVHHVDYSCFSDSFLIYAQEEDPQHFVYVESVVRWFTYHLISQELPVRGALSFGELYVDKQNSVFFGKALCEAYTYGEAQNWLGFVLTPSAVHQLESLNLPVQERIHYRMWTIPYNFKSKSDDGCRLESSLPACVVGSWISRSKNPLLSVVDGMSKKLQNQSNSEKYRFTLEFLNACRKDKYGS